jgi:hypothetical protein
MLRSIKKGEILRGKNMRSENESRRKERGRGRREELTVREL